MNGVDTVDKKAVADVLKRAEVLCKERGVRLTEQRKTVLRLICEAKRPLGAYDILNKLRKSIKTPAPPTVYRALDFLIEQDLIHKLESLHAYISCMHPEHPHTSNFLICSDCGDVSEFMICSDCTVDNHLQNDVVAQIINDVEDTYKFQTQRSIVELFGICSKCSKH